jgi:hypothetical protein
MATIGYMQTPNDRFLELPDPSTPHPARDDDVDRPRNEAGRQPLFPRGHPNAANEASKRHVSGG